MPCHLPECSFDDPSSRQQDESRLGPLDDLEREVEECSPLEKCTPVVSTICEQMFDLGQRL